MATYETIFITSPTLPDDDHREAATLVSQIITEGGGNIIAEDPIGRRRLAYPIRKHEDGHYMRFLYEAGTEIPKEVERRNRLSDKVIRSLTIRLDKHESVRAREQAVVDAQRRVEEEARAAEEAAKAAEEAKAAEAAAAAAAAAAAEAPSEAVATPSEGAPPSEAAAPAADAPAAEAAPAADSPEQPKPDA